jgi:hypothetical protein
MNEIIYSPDDVIIVTDYSGAILGYKINGSDKVCPTCGQYTRGCRDCGAEYDEDGGCGNCMGLLPHRIDR